MSARVLLLALLVVGATASYMSPVHMITPVYDNSRPSQSTQTDCGLTCGSARAPVGTNVVIDNDINVPAWNSKPSSKNFQTFDSKTGSKKFGKAGKKASGKKAFGAKKFGKKSGGGKLRTLRGGRFIFAMANKTLALRKKTKALSKTVKDIARRVDQHKTRVPSLLAGASASAKKLSARASKLLGHIATAVAEKRIKKTDASRLNVGLKKIQKKLQRILKAISFIKGNSKKWEAGLSKKQGPKKAREGVIKAHLVELAKNVDRLNKMLLTSAKRIDKNKRGSKGNVKIIIQLANSLQMDVTFITNKIARSSKLLTPAQLKKNQKALDLIKGRLNRVQPAIAELRKGAAKKKVARKSRKATRKSAKKQPGRKAGRKAGPKAGRKAGRKAGKAGKKRDRRVRKAQTVGLAKQIDDLQAEVMKAARNVDKAKGGVKSLVKMLSAKQQKLTSRLMKLRAKVNKSRAKKRLSKAAVAKENRAFDVMAKKLRQIAKAIRIIKKDNKKKKFNKKRKIMSKVVKGAKQVAKKLVGKKNVKKLLSKSAAKKLLAKKAAKKAAKIVKKTSKKTAKKKLPVAKRFAKRLVKLANLLDLARRRINGLKKLPLKKRLEKLGFEEAELLRKAKKVDRLKIWLGKLSKVKGALTAAELARFNKAVAALSGHIKKLASKLAALKK